MTKPKLTTKEAEVLARIKEAGGATGVSIRYEWTWKVGTESVPETRAIKSLLRKGYLDAIYFRGGTASAQTKESLA